MGVTLRSPSTTLSGAHTDLSSNADSSRPRSQALPGIDKACEAESYPPLLPENLVNTPLEGKKRNQPRHETAVYHV